tara:strand:- start:12 stop:1157 length:1146 start_codon:yes stop_codon:yes gene_type:complete
MGNLLSSDDNENTVLKKLYKLDKNEIEILLKHVSKNKFNNIEIGFINSLKNLNMSLKGKIPDNNYLLVSQFLDILDNSGGSGGSGDYNKTETKTETKTEPKNYSKQEVLKVFNLNTIYKEDELKLSYKKLAMKYHPDRPGGDNEKFQLITKFYIALMEELKLKEEDKQFTELKNNSNDYIKNQQSNNERNFKLNHFQPKLFNQIFDENRVKEDNDGYGEWQKSNEYEEKDIEKNNKLEKNFNTNNFNKIFDKDVKVNHELVEFKVPEAMDSSSTISHTILGAKNINYSTKIYSDFKEAHTTSRIIPTNFKRENYKSVKHLQTERENIKKLSETEIDILNKYEISKKEQENKRIENLRLQEQRHFENYNNIHHKMLNNNILR